MVYCGDSSLPRCVENNHSMMFTEQMAGLEGLRWIHPYACHLDGNGSSEAGLSWDNWLEYLRVASPALGPQDSWTSYMAAQGSKKEYSSE